MALQPVVAPREAPAATPHAPRPPRPGPVHGPWRLAALMWAPHRLGFFLGMLVLAAASLWWLAVQLDRLTGWLQLAPVLSTTLVHGVVMVFGFMPLFFSGFLFTAGPKWLGVAGHGTRTLLLPLTLQAAGWLLWLAGAHVNLGPYGALALFGLLAAGVGLAWMVALFWRLIAASRAADQVHARVVGWAGVFGALCLGGVAAALLAGRIDLALLAARSALWGFIVVTYASVAHRMIPFFTSGVLPMIEVWRPFWVLWLMVGVAAFEVVALWVDFAAPGPRAWPAWTVLAIVVEAAAGGVLLRLAVVWGLVQSLKIRLLAMLHVGFVWFGVALLYSALSQALWLATGRPLLGLGALHALAMGFLGSTMLAMVTRVSCGHSGRALVADDLVWRLFWALQAVVVVRLLAAMQGVPLAVTALAALGWAVVMTVWALRYARWYGTPRIDGQPG